MSVYVDPLFDSMRSKVWKYKKSCHMIADSEEELKRFASCIALKPKWIQNAGTCRVHFDLTAGMRCIAVTHGAIEVYRKKFFEIVHGIVEEEKEE